MAQKKNLSQTVMKALTILEHIAEQGREMGVHEVSRDLGLDPSTTHRHMATLCERGYLYQDYETGKYRVGPRVLLLSLTSQTAELRNQSLPYLHELVERSGETAHLLVLQGVDGVYVAKVDSPKTVRMVSHEGKSEYLHCSAVGKSILAHLPDDEVQRIV